MPSSKSLAIACLVLTISAAELVADVVTVRVDGSGTHPDLQTALDHALPGDTISVGPGEYVLTRPLEARDEKADQVRIVAENGPEETIISMASEPEDPDHASIAIFEDTDVEIEGFTFRGGLGTLLIPPDDTNRIGTRMGGAVLALEDASLVFKNCVFEGNGGPADLQGGAIASWDGWVELRGSTVRRNRAWIGGAISSRDGAIRLYGSRIESNLASRGGGVASGTESSLFAEQTIFAGNFASGGPTGPGYGGALAGGSDSNNFVTNCLFVGNAAAHAGGAISSYEDVDDLVVVNSTIVGNASLAGGSIVKENVELRNSIVWDSDGLPIDVDSPVYVSYSAIEGVPIDMLRGEGDIALEPRFVAPGVFDFTRFEGEFPDFIVELGDYRLASGSPGIDAGSEEGAPGIDLFGVERPCGDGIDLGAYENTDGCAPGTAFRRGDSNADGSINISDPVSTLQWLFAAGAPLPCEKAADFDDDGTVVISDPINQLEWLFRLGLPPRAPLECGLDPTLDSLECEVDSACP